MTTLLHSIGYGLLMFVLMLALFASNPKNTSDSDITFSFIFAGVFGFIVFLITL